MLKVIRDKAIAKLIVKSNKPILSKSLFLKKGTLGEFEELLNFKAINRY